MLFHIFLISLCIVKCRQQPVGVSNVWVQTPVQFVVAFVTVTIYVPPRDYLLSLLWNLHSIHMCMSLPDLAITVTDPPFRLAQLG